MLTLFTHVQFESFAEMNCFYILLFGKSPSQALCQIETGHSHDVAKCRFSCDGSSLVTIGKTDRAIFVWNVRVPDKS